MSLALGFEACDADEEFSNGLFWRFVIGEGDLEETFFVPSPKFDSGNWAVLFEDSLDDTLVVEVDVDATERLAAEETGGGDVFDKTDVEDADEFLGMMEWKADPFPVVVVGLEIGFELGGFGEEAGEPVDPTLGGGGGNE